MTRLARGLLVALLILALLLVAAVLALRTSLPRVRGELELGGISGPVEIVRDEAAVPHILAGSHEDAFFGLGFVHAQERLWQMEFQRRLGSGRLSEILGEATLGTDRFLRTLGLREVAERNLEAMTPRTRGYLEAYAAGVNAFLERRRGLLPLEFLLLRAPEPEPWTPVDTVVWSKMMAWDLGGNWDDELLRARLATRLEPEQIADLWPPYPGDAPIVLPELRARLEGVELERLWAESPKPLPPGAGSNNWVVSGERTVSGAPLLANDPHLGLQAPSVWFFAHLSAPGLEVIGATLPGAPSVLLGRTDRIAWGFTNTGPDVQDLFVERLDPADGSRYLVPGGSEPFEVREETIVVKGGEDVRLRVRSTRHGPVISDAVERAGEVAGEEAVLALRWTALDDDDTTLQAGLNVNFARSWEEFERALRGWVAPQQNIVYADVEGNIGYLAPGRVPIRAGGDGWVPAEGWSGEGDWTGWIPFEELPRELNPEDGVIYTANQKVVTDDYPYFLTRDWAEPYRAVRIAQLLGRVPAHTVESFARIQADEASLMAREFLPLVRAVAPAGATARRAHAALLAWDGDMAADEAAPLVFSAWYREFVRAVTEDELGPLFEDAYGFRPLFVRRVLRERSGWCDDVRTPAEESCAELAGRAFDRAVASLAERHGDDPEAWRWGEAHRAVFDHAVMTNSPLRLLFDLTAANGGDPYTVDAARYAIGNAEHPFRQTTGPSYRAIYDLADLDRSRFMHGPGQSGNPASVHYRDLLEAWAEVDYLPMRTDLEAFLGEGGSTLRLEPRGTD